MSTENKVNSLIKTLHGITWLTKVHILKAMVFPVVMYRCESWTIKKADHKECFSVAVLKMDLERSLNCKEIKPVNPEGNQS